MGNSRVRKIVFTGMLSAIYVVLKYVSANIGVDIKVNIAILPVAYAAIMFGTPEGIATALIGEFIIQMVQYGFSATTALWILPPAIHGLVIGLVARKFRKTVKKLFMHPVIMLITLLVSAVLVTFANTLVLVVDSKIYGYPYAFVALTTIWRFLIGMGSAVISWAILLPLCRAMDKFNKTSS